MRPMPTRVVVAAGQHAGPGRRAQRGGVEVRVAQPAGRQAVDVRASRCRSRSSRAARSRRRRARRPARSARPRARRTGSGHHASRVGAVPADPPLELRRITHDPGVCRPCHPRPVRSADGRPDRSQDENVDFRARREARRCDGRRREEAAVSDLGEIGPVGRLGRPSQPVGVVRGGRAARGRPRSSRTTSSSRSPPPVSPAHSSRRTTFSSARTLGRASSPVKIAVRSEASSTAMTVVHAEPSGDRLEVVGERRRHEQRCRGRRRRGPGTRSTMNDRSRDARSALP